MMSTKNTSIFVVILIVIATLVGVYFWPNLPEQMASHWNAQNQVDGWISRFWGVFLLPVISLGMFALFLILPKINPLKENIATFRDTFNAFIFFLVAFLVYLYLLTIFFNLGYAIKIGPAMLPALGVFIFYAGVLMGRAKRNWFIGIRTPWTLSNDKVWEETHRLGGIIFKACGVLAILGAFFERYAVWFVLIPLLAASIFLTIYSYFVYIKDTRSIEDQ